MNASFYPVTKSFLSHEALARTIETEYDLRDVHCQLITASMRDVYRITSRHERHTLLIYRHNQRTAAEIAAEWEFVDYLYAKGVPVAPAVPQKTGELLLSLAAPEGTRYGVLSKYCDGKHLRQRPSVKAVRVYGQIIARIHTLADAKSWESIRPTQDVDRLLDEFVAAFEAEIPERFGDLAYLRQSAEILRHRTEALPLPQQAPYYGMIHGDVIRANAQVADDGCVTVLDFDLCGPGWRVYDIASYLAVVKGLPEGEESERAFLGGYQEIRSITEIERAVLPLFEAVRAIFSLGIPVLNVYHWGSAYLDAFWDYHLERLRRKMAAIV